MSVHVENVTVETSEGTFFFDYLYISPKGKVVESEEGSGRPTRDGEVLSVDFECENAILEGISIKGSEFEDRVSEELINEIKDVLLSRYEEDLTIDVEENWEDDDDDCYYDAVGKYLKDEK